MKKRYIIILCVLGMVAFGTWPIAYTRPVLPFIQLPGEILPGTKGIPLLGGITNTFVATVLTWIIVALIALSLRAHKRSADEVPTGFYNVFEMIVEGAYGFAERIAGPKVRELFPFFMTFAMIILVANWMELIPGVDSIGVWEYLPHLEAEKVAEEREAVVPFESEEERDHFVHEQEELFVLANPAANKPDVALNDGLFLIRADGNASKEYEIEENGDHQLVGRNPAAQQWTIVPFVRAAATDLNFTLAFALVSMFMVQYYGFKYLGVQYLSKFFPFINSSWRKSVSGSPIKAIDPVVGIFELIGEISKIISFAFRLLGNIFAGQILLFVMAFLLPVANVVFFGLEFFVGLIQAIVFALLSLIFMVQATHGHYDEEDHH